MNILVTGSSGLIGEALKNICNKDVNNFFFCNSSTCDLRDAIQTDYLFSKYNPDIVIHLASLVAGLYGNFNNNYKFLTDNIKINNNILDVCKKYKVKKLINILSTCMFSNTNVIYPLTSDQILNGEPDESNIGYALSKRFLYNGSKILVKSCDLQVINLIPTNLYGKNDNYNEFNGHVLPALIHKVYKSIIIGNDLIIKGNGSARRQFVFADDFASIILQFVELKLDDNFISCIICPNSSQELSIKTLVDYICSKFNYNGNIIYDETHYNGQILKTSSDTELLHYLPDFKFTSLDDGLNITIEYFKTHYNIIRK